MAKRFRCIFCDVATKLLTQEHSLPKWLAKYIPGDGEFNVTFDIDGTQAFAYSELDLEITARAVCATCNNGWMSQLESNVAHVLGPLVAGASMTLTTDMQKLLALWAAKTAAVFTYTGRELAVDQIEHCHWIYNKRTVPPATWVWLAPRAFVPEEVVKVHTLPLMMQRPSAPEAARLALDWTVALGHLVLKVLFMPNGWWTENISIGAPTLHLIHPDPVEVNWPSGTPLTPLDFDIIKDGLIKRYPTPGDQVRLAGGRKGSPTT